MGSACGAGKFERICNALAVPDNSVSFLKSEVSRRKAHRKQVTVNTTRRTSFSGLILLMTGVVRMNNIRKTTGRLIR